MDTQPLAHLDAVTTEILGRDDLEQLLNAKKEIRHYIGFEISGLVHLGTGLMSGLVVANLQKLGVHTTYFLADWHTWINNKLGGDRNFIKTVANEYFGPALKVSAKIAGADENKIDLVLGSDLYHNNDAYWSSMIDVAKNLTLSRVVKSTTIMGRAESESMPFGYLIYPPMQVADIFTLKASIAHAGTDQRKVHVIAREVAPKLSWNPLKDVNGNPMKPIAIHHPLLLGLQKPATWPIPQGEQEQKDVIRTQMKMSKSIPGSAIFIHDSEDEVRQKIMKAFCPEKEIELNPILDWVRHLILPLTGELAVKREERYGGSFRVTTMGELEERYVSGELFPLDLKNAVALRLVEILAPAREFFASRKGLIDEIVERSTR